MIAASHALACGADETPPESPPPSQIVQPTTPVETATAAVATTPTANASPAPFDASAPHGGLLPEQVRRVVMHHTGELRACYEAVASNDADLRGTVIVAWRIDAQGSVHNTNIVSSTLPAPSVAGCVVRQIASWQFDASDKPTFVAQYPFKFGVGKEDAGSN